MVWSMLPGAQMLTPTRVVDVRHVVRTGFATVHTLQGQHTAPALSYSGAERLPQYRQQQHRHI